MKLKDPAQNNVIFTHNACNIIVNPVMVLECYYKTTRPDGY